MKLKSALLLLAMQIGLPNIEATTRSGYKDKIKNQINPHLGNIQLKALTPNTIQKWVNKLHKDQGLSPKTIRNAFLNLSAALEKAVVTQMIATNPCKGVELPKNQKYKAQIYTKQEIIQLLDLAKDTDMYIPLLLVCYVGFRRGELLALKWERFVEKHGLKKIRFHDLRHSCTTMMVEAGIDMKTVQTRIGHANITTTMNTYAHCTPAMDQSAADKLDDILFA